METIVVAPRVEVLLERLLKFLFATVIGILIRNRDHRSGRRFDVIPCEFLTRRFGFTLALLRRQPRANGRPQSFRTVGELDGILTMSVRPGAQFSRRVLPPNTLNFARLPMAEHVQY